MLPRGKFACLVSCWLVGFSGASALAQSAPKLDALSRTWFQRGTTNEITFTGDALAGVNELRFTGSGVSGVVTVKVTTNLVLETSAGGLTAGTPANAKSAAGRLIIQDQAPIGSREVRLVGPSGISNPLTLQISDLPEINETKPNQSAAQATALTLPVAVSGVVEKATDSDWFRFSARAGQRLIFDVQANRQGSPLDATLAVLDSSGRELARSEDAHGLDPFLEFAPPADGEYFVRLNDLRFQGGGDYRYRLVAGQIPYLDSLFPLGGRRGSSVEVALRGRNLDGVDRLALQIADDAPLGRQDLRARTGRGNSNPLPFEISDLPDFLDTEPNNEREKANTVSVPVAINGRLGEPRDADSFRFRAPANQRLVIEVRARSFGSPVDALLILADAAGNVLQQNDDAAGPDARIEFDAKQNTEYVVTLRDLTERGGEAFGYRLTIQPPNTGPDFVVRANAARLRVARGGTTAVRCEVERRNGFNGVVRIAGQFLPAGVSSDALVIAPEGPQFGWLNLHATAAAQPETTELVMKGTAEISGNLAIRNVQFNEGAFLTVLPEAAFTLDVTTPALQLEQNTSGQVEVSIQRRPGFTSEVRILAEELGGVSFGGLTLPPGESRGKLSVTAAYNCEASTRSVMFRGEARVDGQPVVEYASRPVPLAVTPIPYFITAMLPGSPFFRMDAVKLSAVALPTNTTSAASSSEFVVKVDRRNFTNQIELELEGLPTGVLATVKSLAGSAKEAPIRLVVSDQTASPTNYTFTVNSRAVFGDRVFRQKSVPITLNVAAPERETAAVTPAGR